MKRSLLSVLLVLFASSLTFIGCDSTPNVTTQQFVNELEWMPDGSGLLAVIMKVSSDITTGGTTYQAGLYRVSTNGTIGDAFNIPDKSLPQGYPTVIGISKDGRTAITELGTTVYRIDLSGNSAKAMIRSEYLMGVSQSLKYVLVTETDASLNTRFASIYDVSGASARRVKDFTMNGLYGARAQWIGDSLFAIWGIDSTLHNETQVYDTTGRILRTIQTSVVANQKSGYAPDSNALFLFNRATQGIDRVDVTTLAVSSVLSNDTVESMDVTPSGNLIAYASGGSIAPFGLFALNPATGTRQNIASSAYEVALSPFGNSGSYCRSVNLLCLGQSDVRIFWLHGT